MSEPERSSFESNLFTFKSKKANRIASYCLLGGLCAGFFLGVIFAFGGELPLSLSGVWRWFRVISLCTATFALLGLAVGFVIGTRMDRKKRKTAGNRRQK